MSEPLEFKTRIASLEAEVARLRLFESENAEIKKELAKIKAERQELRELLDKEAYVLIGLHDEVETLQARVREFESHKAD